MSNAFKAQLPYIGTTSTLGWQNDAIAQSYMDHILQRARVLLPRRGWRVGIIKEFYPRGASLLGLNVNAGSEVCVRFRVPGKRNEFLPFHEVLCTALHEFTHCVHSRHDRAFWNLYYDLVKECEALEVTMIQQGKQLYPEAAYVPQDSAGASTTGAASSSTSGRGRRKGAAPTSFPATGGHRLGSNSSNTTHGGGGGSATGSGRGRGGGGTQTCGRSGTTTTTTTTIKKRGPSSTPTAPTTKPTTKEGIPASAGVFPGAGRRLGEGGGLRQYDTAPGFTPTRDALRRIMAAAAERRQRQHQGSPDDKTPTPDKTGTELQSVDALPEDGVVDEDDVPDHVPLSQTAMEESNGGWRCVRCGFCNEAGVHGCQFCDNEEDREGDQTSSVVMEDSDAETADMPDEPVAKAARTEAVAEVGTTATSGAALSNVSSPLPHAGATRDDAFEISDDE